MKAGRATRKRRSGWKHPLDIERNRRRCAKRRRSASACVRHAIELLRAEETRLELLAARREAVKVQRQRRPAPCLRAMGGRVAVAG